MKHRSTATFVSDAIRDLLRANDLGDLDALFHRFDAGSCRHKGRAVYSQQLTELDGSDRRVFVKLNWGRRRIWPRSTDLKTGQVLQTLPEREWRGLNALQSIGLNVPFPLALFREGYWRFRSAVVVEAVPPPLSIDEMIQFGDWQELTTDAQSDLLQTVVETVRRIHRAGLAWRGTTSRHFFPHREPDQPWQVWLIDCEGVHRLYSKRLIARDFQKLIRAFIESSADGETITRLERLIAAA